MTLNNIFLLILGCLIGIFFYSIFGWIIPNIKIRQFNVDLIEKEKQLQEQIDELNTIKTKLEDQIQESTRQRDDLLSQSAQITRSLHCQMHDTKLAVQEFYDSEKKAIDLQLDNEKIESQQKFKQAEEEYITEYMNTLKEYTEEFTKQSKLIENQYNDKILFQQKEIDRLTVELNKLKELHTAAIDARLREEEIKEQQNFYRIVLSDKEKRDIKLLDSIKNDMADPRIVNMLIWQTYYRTPMTNLCNRIIDTTNSIGIYKITNQNTGLCYIGQAVDLAKRWKQHAKAGLGIDTPVGNKLYKAMINEGLYNFTFEVLEYCSKESLNEKEKFYIQLYDSYNYGYNSNKGVG